MVDPTQNEWQVNEQLQQKREQLRKRVEQGLIEDPELKGVDTIGVKLETGGAVKEDELSVEA